MHPAYYKTANKIGLLTHHAFEDSIELDLKKIYLVN